MRRSQSFYEVVNDDRLEKQLFWLDLSVADEDLPMERRSNDVNQLIEYTGLLTASLGRDNACQQTYRLMWPFRYCSAPTR